MGRSFLHTRLIAALSAFWLSAAALTPCAPAHAEDALIVENKIALGSVRGRIDHLAADVARRRLFVAELGNGSVSAVDLGAGTVAGRVTGLEEPQGIAFVPTVQAIYVASGGDGTLRRYNALDLAPSGPPLKLGRDADNVRFDARTGQIVVGYGSGALALIDAATGRRLGDVVLPAHPESFQLDRDGPLVFVNVPDANRVSVVDRLSAREVSAWTVPTARSNFPMALDDAAGHVLVVYRTPATLTVFSAATGTIVDQLATCRDADDVFVDRGRNRVYVICGEGSVAVVQRRGDRYTEIGRVATVSGARTGLFVPEWDRLYVAARAQSGAPAAIWVMRPEP